LGKVLLRHETIGILILKVFQIGDTYADNTRIRRSQSLTSVHIFACLILVLMTPSPSCSVLQCVAVCCSVLQCVAVCCRVLQSVAECCNVLQCVAVCCSVLQCGAVT